MVLSFPIDPVPCPRPRHSLVGKRCPQCKRGTIPVAYYTEAYKKFKAEAGKQFKRLTQGTDCPLVQGPLTVRLIVTVRRPKTTLRSMPKPDVDNYAKAVLDAANKVVWDDDSLIKRLVVEKEWGPSGRITMEVVPYERKTDARRVVRGR